MASAEAGDARVEVTAAEHPGPRDSDRLIRWLDFDCRVRLPRPGRWNIMATVSDREQYFSWSVPGTAFAGSIALASATYQRTNGGSADVDADSLGDVRFRLRFDGNDLAHLDADGPWHLCLSAFSTDSAGNYDAKRSVSAALHAVTGSWRRDQFRAVYSGEFDRFDPGLQIDMRGGEELVFTQGWDLMVATVVRADTGGTRGYPPRLTLRADHVFQGRLPQARFEAGWNPEPEFMPCPVGEEGNIARWAALPYGAPAVGSRWILGGCPDSRSGLWVPAERCRWPYSDSTFTYFQNAVRRWDSKLRRLRKLYERDRVPQERSYRERRRREERVRSAKRRSDERAQRVKARHEELARRQREAAETRRFLARARLVARNADLERLVEESDCILVGRVGFDPGSARASEGLLLVEERLLAESPSDTARLVRVHFTPREDSLGALWMSAPGNRKSLESKEGIRLVAFLRQATISPRFAMPATILRPVDPRFGLLLAEPETMKRLRSARAGARAGLHRAETPGTTWNDFAAVPPAQLPESAVRISLLYRPRFRSDALCSLVLSCPADSSQPASSPDRIWPRAFPDSVYRADRRRAGVSLTVRPEEMAGFMDSLLAFAELRGGRVDAGDSVSVMLTRMVAGREVRLERTLEHGSLDRLGWLLIRMATAGDDSAATRRPTRPVERDLVPWVSGFRPNVFAAYARDVWRARYGPPPRRTARPASGQIH